jgi:hypothetical protein
MIMAIRLYAIYGKPKWMIYIFGVLITAEPIIYGQLVFGGISCYSAVQIDVFSSHLVLIGKGGGMVPYLTPE